MTTNRTTIHQLPIDSLQLILSHLSLREIFACRAVCRLFQDALTCPFFLQQVSLRSTLNWFVVHPSNGQKSCGASPNPLVRVYDADSGSWIVFPLDFLPFTSTIPVAASAGLLYLWCESESGSSLVVCNPFTRTFRVLPQLGSIRHGAVLWSGWQVLVFNKLAALYLAEGSLWSNFSSGLSSESRSPVIVGSTVYALCNIGSPIGSQWKLFFCKLDELGSGRSWDRLERQKWGEILDILHRPRLIQGKGESLLVVGGLKSSFMMSSVCSTIILLQLDLLTLEWDEAGRMPADFFECFQSLDKFKVFGKGDRVFFSGKGGGKLAMWDSSGTAKGRWAWVSDASDNKDDICRGFSFDPRIHAVP